MMGQMFRAAFLGAGVWVAATTAVLAQQTPDTLPDNIVAELNTAAANNSDPAAYASAVASIVAANPDLASSIAAQAVETRPGAAVALAQAIAPVVTNPTIA